MEPTRTAAPPSQDWTQVAGVEPKRQEAERIHRALTVAEVANVPELPWKASKPKQTSSSPQGGAGQPRWHDCSRCGKRLEPGEYARDGVRGPYICREGCPAVGTEAA